MLLVEKVGRVARVENTRDVALVAFVDRIGPFPDTAIVAIHLLSRVIDYRPRRSGAVSLLVCSISGNKQRYYMMKWELVRVAG
jgi:hypothetical protein